MTEPAVEQRASVRLDGLTGTRALAAGAVLVHHYGPVASPHLRGISHLGYLGVSFFFALSGFVLTYSARPSSVRDFYQRRFARVWPTHAVALLFAVLVVGGMRSGPVAANVVLLQGWVPDSDWYFGGNIVAWSLCSEAFFYALTPWLLRVVSGTRPLRTLGSLLGGFAVIQSFMTLALPVDVRLWAGYIVPLAGLPIFLAGMIVARGIQQQTLPKVSLRLAGSVVAGSLVAAYAVQEILARAGRDDPAARGVLIALTLPSFLLVIAAVASQELGGNRTWLGRPLMTHLGAWSFVFYLVHTSVLALVTDHSARGGWAWALIALVGAVALSGLLHHAVEGPLERRLRSKRCR